MAAGRPLKFVGIACGGVCSLGIGVLGAYFAQPTFETHVNPEKTEREIQIQKTISEQDSQIELISEKLSRKKVDNSEKAKDISRLEKDIYDLKIDLSDKDRIYVTKDHQLKKQNEKIQMHDEISRSQQNITDCLKHQIKTHESELEQEKKNIQNLKNQLDSEKQRISLAKENILEEQTLKLSLLKVNMHRVTKKETKGNVTAFEWINDRNEKVNFSVDKSNFTNHEYVAKGLREKGMPCGLDNSFKNWNKQIVVHVYDLDFSHSANNSEKERNFAKSLEDYEINMSEYFKDQYFEDAFRVLMAIKEMETFPFCRAMDRQSETNPLNFCEKLDIDKDFFSQEKMNLPVFSGVGEDSKLHVWVSRFKTFNDFIRYWAIKTVDFVKIKRINLFDFLNPALLSDNYQ